MASNNSAASGEVEVDPMVNIRQCTTKDILIGKAEIMKRGVDWDAIEWECLNLVSGPGEGARETVVKIVSSFPAYKEIFDEQRRAIGEIPSWLHNVEIRGTDGFVPCHHVFLLNVSPLLDSLIKERVASNDPPTPRNVLSITVDGASVNLIRNVLSFLYTGWTEVDTKDKEDFRNLLLMLQIKKVKLNQVPRSSELLPKKLKPLAIVRCVKGTEEGQGLLAVDEENPQSVSNEILPDATSPRPSTSATARLSTSSSSGPTFDHFNLSALQIRKVKPIELVEKSKKERIKRQVYMTDDSDDEDDDEPDKIDDKDEDNNVEEEEKDEKMDTVPDCDSDSATVITESRKRTLATMAKLREKYEQDNDYVPPYQRQGRWTESDEEDDTAVADDDEKDKENVKSPIRGRRAASSRARIDSTSSGSRASSSSSVTAIAVPVTRRGMPSSGRGRVGRPAKRATRRDSLRQTSSQPNESGSDTEQVAPSVAVPSPPPSAAPPPSPSPPPVRRDLRSRKPPVATPPNENRKEQQQPMTWAKIVGRKSDEGPNKPKSKSSEDENDSNSDVEFERVYEECGICHKKFNGVISLSKHLAAKCAKSFVDYYDLDKKFCQGCKFGFKTYSYTEFIRHVGTCVKVNHKKIRGSGAGGGGGSKKNNGNKEKTQGGEPLQMQVDVDAAGEEEALRRPNEGPIGSVEVMTLRDISVQLDNLCDEVIVKVSQMIQNGEPVHITRPQGYEYPFAEVQGKPKEMVVVVEEEESQPSTSKQAVAATAPKKKPPSRKRGRKGKRKLATTPNPNPSISTVEETVASTSSLSAEVVEPPPKKVARENVNEEVVVEKPSTIQSENKGRRGRKRKAVPIPTVSSPLPPQPSQPAVSPPEHSPPALSLPSPPQPTVSSTSDPEDEVLAPPPYLLPQWPLPDVTQLSQQFEKSKPVETVTRPMVAPSSDPEDDELPQMLPPSILQQQLPAPVIVPPNFSIVVSPPHPSSVVPAAAPFITPSLPAPKTSGDIPCKSDGQRLNVCLKSRLRHPQKKPAEPVPPSPEKLIDAASPPLPPPPQPTTTTSGPSSCRKFGEAVAVSMKRKPGPKSKTQSLPAQPVLPTLAVATANPSSPAKQISPQFISVAVSKAVEATRVRNLELEKKNEETVETTQEGPSSNSLSLSDQGNKKAVAAPTATSPTEEPPLQEIVSSRAETVIVTRPEETANNNSTITEPSPDASSTLQAVQLLRPPSPLGVSRNLSENEVSFSSTSEAIEAAEPSSQATSPSTPSKSKNLAQLSLQTSSVSSYSVPISTSRPTSSANEALRPSKPGFAHNFLESGSSAAPMEKFGANTVPQVGGRQFMIPPPPRLIPAPHVSAAAMAAFSSSAAEVGGTVEGVRSGAAACVPVISTANLENPPQPQRAPSPATQAQSAPQRAPSPEQTVAQQPHQQQQEANQYHREIRAPVVSQVPTTHQVQVSLLHQNQVVASSPQPQLRAAANSSAAQLPMAFRSGRPNASMATPRHQPRLIQQYRQRQTAIRTGPIHRPSRPPPSYAINTASGGQGVAPIQNLTPPAPPLPNPPTSQYLFPGNQQVNGNLYHVVSPVDATPLPNVVPFWPDPNMALFMSGAQPTAPPLANNFVQPETNSSNFATLRLPVTPQMNSLGAAGDPLMMQQAPMMNFQERDSISTFLAMPQGSRSIPFFQEQQAQPEMYTQNNFGRPQTNKVVCPQCRLSFATLEGLRAHEDEGLC